MEKVIKDLWVERSESKKNWSMASSHAHPFHELYFLVSGRRRYFLGHTIYDISPGNLVLIPKQLLHQTTVLGNQGYDRYVLYFNETEEFILPKMIGRENFDRLMASGCLQLPPEATRQILRDLEQMEQEEAAQSEYSVAMGYHLLEDILLCALRFGKPKQQCRGEVADKVQEVSHYITENYARELPLTEAAKMACMEETYFSKRFKALTGFGFQEYLTQTRLLAAEELLRETNLTMSEIAELCGFSGSNYFGDVFRRRQGMAPTEYRRRCRQEQ